MQKWEYTSSIIAPYHRQELHEMRMEQFKIMGEEGWELVLVDEWRYYWKRPVTEEKE